jgi:hypothetical protein
MPPADCNQSAGRFVASNVMRRLSPDQYNRAVLDVFGDTSSPASAFPAESRKDGYNNQSDAQAAQREHVERWGGAAQAVASKAAGGIITTGCAGQDLAACVPDQLLKIGYRLFRRPLNTEEQQRYQAFYTQNQQTGTPEEALEATLMAMLMSPHFLFVIERGAPIGNGVVQLTGYEVASRLSLTLLGAPPDEALLAKAAAGELDTAEGVGAQARAMLLEQRNTDVVRDFHGQWIGLQEAEKLKLPEGTPPEAALAAKEEVEWFIQDWYKTGTGKLADLFLSPRAWVSKDLATIYGVTAPDQPAQIDLPADQRAGLLTRVMFLGTHSNPAARGEFILRQVLCAPIPAVAVMPPDAPDIVGATTRERFEQHATNPCASACHGQLDPVGFVFENYDAHGVWRATENGKPINAATEIKMGKPDVDGPVDGALGISEKLATSRTVSDCLATHWFQFANARPAEPQDRCSVFQLQEKLATTGGDVRELLIASTQVDSFRFARKEGL